MATADKAILDALNERPFHLTNTVTRGLLVALHRRKDISAIASMSSAAWRLASMVRGTEMAILTENGPEMMLYISAFVAHLHAYVALPEKMRASFDAEQKALSERHYGPQDEDDDVTLIQTTVGDAKFDYAKEYVALVRRYFGPNDPSIAPLLRGW